MQRCAFHTFIHYRHSIENKTKSQMPSKFLISSWTVFVRGSTTRLTLHSISAPKSEFISLARSPDLSIGHIWKSDHYRVFLLVGWATFKSETKGASNISDIAKANEYDSKTKPRNITLAICTEMWVVASEVRTADRMS